MGSSFKFGLACATVAGIAMAEAVAAPMACTARSGATITPVVELYTSEGCNSCPPADRWLGAMKLRSDVVALAFHVDYWDRLGWKDRFASPVYTQRQVEQQAVNGARFPYTPQVVIEGHDRKDWPRVAVGRGSMPAAVGIELLREGDRITAQVIAGAGAPSRLAAYWAVTEANHRSVVKAGENEGATLAHEFVVREYMPVLAWAPARGTAQALTYTLHGASDAAHPRRVNLVVVDAASGQPVQALALDCG
jgi:hypothetical protein